MPKQPANIQATPTKPVPQSKMPWYKNPIDIAIALILLILYISGNVLLYNKYFGSQKNNTAGKQSIFSSLTNKGGGLPDKVSDAIPTPTINPTPYFKPKPIATGKQEFVVSGGGKTGPKFSKIIVDPLDPKKDAVQTVSVYVNDISDVTSVTLTVRSDTKSTPYVLKLIEGDAKKGIWSGSWKANDTYEKIYMYIIEAVSASGKNKVEPVFR